MSDVADPGDTGHISADARRAAERDAGLSPFSGYAEPDGSASSSTLDTVRVMAMLASLAMAGGAALVVVLLVLLVGGTASGILELPTVAAQKPAAEDEVQVLGPRAAPAPKGGKGVAEAPVEEGPAPAREVQGTIVLDLRPGQLFVSIEAKCPSTPLVRRRAEIRGSRVSIVLPDNEDCKLTFQGSSPEQTYLRGGVTKTCTFAPTNCR
jgi:hypothetical protein